jgi:hypothetical protein
MYTTDCNFFRVINYNTVQQGYYKWTGCTNVISVSPINPLDSIFVCAKNLLVEEYGAPLDITWVGLCPSPTPTPTNTPSVTPTSITQTPTPTQTNTPSVTPTTPPPIYTYNLWTGGYYQDVCNATNFGNPANVTIFCLKPFSSLVPGDHVYGNKQLTIPPVNANFTISNGGRFIQVSGTLILNTGLCS